MRYLRVSTLLIDSKLLRAEGLDDDLRLQVPDLDAIVGSGTKPVAVGGKDKAVDDLPGIERVQALSFVKIPKVGGSVLATRGTETAVRGDTNCVEVPSVSDEVVSELAVRQGPDLDKPVPPARDDERHGLRRRESDTRDPLAVPVAVSADGVLALAEGVPELDGPVPRAADDLSVVNAEGYRKDVLRVSDESTRGASRVDLPEAEGAVPGPAKSELSVRRDNDVGDEVAVAAEGALSVTIRVVLTAVRVGKTPDQDGLVAGGGEDEVGILRRCGDADDMIT